MNYHNILFELWLIKATVCSLVVNPDTMIFRIFNIWELTYKFQNVKISALSDLQIHLWGCNSDSPNLEKKKFLVFHAMTWKEFKKTVAKHTSSRHQPHRPLKVTVGGVQPTSNTSMSDVYKNHKSIDGFLYVTVEGFAEEHGQNVDQVAQIVTSALQSVQTDSRDHKKLTAAIEQLATRVAALESNGKKIAAETKQFGEQVAAVERALKKTSLSTLTSALKSMTRMSMSMSMLMSMSMSILMFIWMSMWLNVDVDIDVKVHVKVNVHVYSHGDADVGEMFTSMLPFHV